MTTYKRLGLKMSRDGEQGWRVVDNNGVELYKGNGNKGTVMHDCLHQCGKYEIKFNKWVCKDAE